MSLLVGRIARRVATLLLLTALAAASRQELRGQSTSQPQTVAEAVEIDLNAPSHPFPHFWEKMFGSGRAILSLRDSYRHDLRETKRVTGFEPVGDSAGHGADGGRTTLLLLAEHVRQRQAG